ncbi:exodeoxyribonuclease V subunit beta [Dokdonella sp.]|uniref:exodeoxyribonuclease V subunit beta n=1 Tax=Dokdonella sp. TaxID=2291710 RepID=UPI003C36C296
MMRELDVTTLPLTGQHLVEASAGTGKTHNIGLLYLRLLLESGLAVDEIAVVTFTDAATRELRARLRKRIVEAIGRLKGDEASSADELGRILSKHSADRASVQRTLNILSEAVVGFDEAQVSTLHGLCARQLADLAFETGQPFVELEAGSRGDATLELVRDFWRRQIVAEPDIAFEAVLRRWSDPEALARFFAQSQALSLSPECIDPADPGALALDARARLDAALTTWRNLLGAGQVADAVAAIEELLASKLLSVDKNKGAHHAMAMAALRSTLEFEDVVASPDMASLRPLARSAIEKGSAKKLRDRGWQPEGALLHVAECVEAIGVASADLESALLARFVRSALDFVRDGLSARQARLRRLGFDDLIGNLHKYLHGSEGASIAATIAERLPAILVDEFQDTDALQYGILRRIHAARPDSGLFLIGDPKQAIYRFRGGDIFTYRKASDDTDGQHATLLANWRSDERLITATNAVFSGVDDAFLYPFIGFQPARFPEQRETSAQEHADSAPMTVWRIPNRYSDKGQVKPWTVGDVSRRVLVEVARTIKKILRETPGSGEDPASIAVLVNTNRQAEEAARELAKWNVACDYLSAVSVFASDEAAQLECLIAAISAPGDAAVVRAALATELLGENLDSLLAAHDDLDRWEGQLARIADLRVRWQEAGPYAVIAHCVQEAGARLLPHWNGRRVVTNLLHLAELLQKESMRRTSPDELLRWLAERRAEAAARRGEGNAELVRAADDGGSVQVLTIHRSKGLQYDCVFAPFLFSTRWQRLSESTEPDQAVSWHDKTEARIDIGGPEWFEHALLNREEQFAESLRLAYVAITRARHRVWIAWAYANTGKLGDNSLTSALSWLWFRNSDMIDPSELATLDPESFAEKLDALVLRSDASIAVVALDHDPPAIDDKPIRDTTSTLQAKPFAGQIDRRFTTWSYSRLFGGNQHAPVADHDESVATTPFLATLVAVDPVPQWPRGAQFGDCVHAVFEQIPFADLARDTPPERLATICDDHGFAESDHAVVAGMTRAATTTELLPGSGLTLAMLKGNEARPELEFLLPLGGSDLEHFETHLRQDARYARPEGELRARRSYVAGLMTGFIDLVLRWQGRYYVLDYKTNLLGADRSDYAPAKLPIAIRAHDYDLQYLIYLVALQRFLRSRLGDAYSYETHVGGALYLFVRGMREGDTAGIHHDRPPATLIDALDAWCDGDRT